MVTRLWYQQLDVYDTARRMCMLLQFFKYSPGFERLAIADFYLSTPPLLHSVSMSRDVRKIFNSLNISKPDKVFVALPAPQILFHKMESVQKQALIALSSRGLVSNEELRAGRVVLTGTGRSVFDLKSMLRSDEKELCEFLAMTLFDLKNEGNKELRVQTGLRRLI